MWAHFVGKVLKILSSSSMSLDQCFFLGNGSLAQLAARDLIYFLYLCPLWFSYWCSQLRLNHAVGHCCVCFCKKSLQIASWACPITSLTMLLPLGNCSAGLCSIVMVTLIRWSWALPNKEILGLVWNLSVSFAPLWHFIVFKDRSSGVGALQIWWNLVLGIWLWPKDSHIKLKFMENFWRHLKFDHSS